MFNPMVYAFLYSNTEFVFLESNMVPCLRFPIVLRGLVHHMRVYTSGVNISNASEYLVSST